MKSAPCKLSHAFISILLLGAIGCSGHGQTVRTCTYSQMASVTTTKDRTVHVLAVDLNRDGVLDVVGTNHGGMSLEKGTISVALGTGDGRFAAATTYTMGDAGPYETTSADFNGDGYPDLAVELFGTSDRTIIGTEVDVLINNGDGTFKPFVPYTSGDKPRAVKAADLNNDGKQDIVVANSHFNSIGVMLGTGDGRFEPRIDYPAGVNPHGIVVTDFNNDGQPDVAVCNNIFHPHGAVNVLLAKGNGAFFEPDEYVVGAGAFGLDAGDLNGDGYPDIVSAGNRAASISVLINTGTGVFTEAVDYPVSEQPITVVLGDLQGDGRLDALSSSRKGTDLLIGNGEGSFQASILMETGSSYDSAVADFDGDGIMDIATAVTTGSIGIMKGTCE